MSGEAAPFSPSSLQAGDASIEPGMMPGNTPQKSYPSGLKRWHGVMPLKGSFWSLLALAIGE